MFAARGEDHRRCSLGSLSVAARSVEGRLETAGVGDRWNVAARCRLGQRLLGKADCLVDLAHLPIRQR